MDLRSVKAQKLDISLTKADNFLLRYNFACAILANKYLKKRPVVKINGFDLYFGLSICYSKSVTQRLGVQFLSNVNFFSMLVSSALVIDNSYQSCQ